MDSRNRGHRASADGEQWRADVLAQKGNARAAVEIQWSGQTNDETLRRQERYKQCGIRGLWLLRQPDFPVAHSLPAVCLGGNLRDGFTALIPHYGAQMNARDRNHFTQWRQAMPLREFLDAAFSGRFRFGVPLDTEARVTVLGAETTCWACPAKTRKVTGIIVEVGFVVAFAISYSRRQLLANAAIAASRVGS